jgi:recombination DNA repair RAD52 pathway protein
MDVAPSRPKKVLSEAQLDILRKAREKALAVRRDKALASQAVKSLKQKETELERLTIMKKTEMLEHKLAQAKSAEAEPGPEQERAADPESPRQKTARRKRRPNAPMAKRRQVVRYDDYESDEMEEDDQWSEWVEHAKPPPRHAVPYRVQPPRASTFDPRFMQAKAAAETEAATARNRLAFQAIWGNL